MMMPIKSPCEELAARSARGAVVSGYRDAIWVSVGLALLSALSAQMIQSKKRTVEKQGVP
jgi:hypothetical protein